MAEFDFLDDFLAEDQALEQVDTSSLDGLSAELKGGKHGKKKKRAQADREDRAASEALEDMRRVAAEMQLDIAALNTGNAGDVRSMAESLLANLEGQSASKHPDFTSSGPIQRDIPQQASLQPAADSVAFSENGSGRAVYTPPAKVQQQPAKVLQQPIQTTAPPAMAQPDDLDDLLDRLSQPVQPVNNVAATRTNIQTATSVDDLLDQLSRS